MGVVGAHQHHAHRAELHQSVVALKPQHHAAEHADQHDKKQRLGADDKELLHGARKNLGAGEYLGQTFKHEQCRVAKSVYAVQAGAAYLAQKIAESFGCGHGLPHRPDFCGLLETGFCEI